MRAVIQRVRQAEVHVNDERISGIGPGILTLLGIEAGDDEATLLRLLTKIAELRIFEDSDGKMNLSAAETRGEHLIVSQFTLLGDCAKGRRPSFIRAEKPEKARLLFERALAISQNLGLPTQGGRFQADMKVSLVNDGPVTFVLDLSPDRP
ncbi:MAG: D-tyrosyl-tRNA(Tyr) deacylase [Bdellovibrionales bacterium]|nr:D-tyrosyl-tRNA(Tyr) deacylase [Bdellovibrionales bacterium]